MQKWKWRNASGILGDSYLTNAGLNTEACLAKVEEVEEGLDDKRRTSPLVLLTQLPLFMVTSHYHSCVLALFSQFVRIARRGSFEYNSNSSFLRVFSGLCWPTFSNGLLTVRSRGKIGWKVEERCASQSELFPAQFITSFPLSLMYMWRYIIANHLLLL